MDKEPALPDGSRSGSAKWSGTLTAKIAPGRDERLFLLLSIFIGVISGLLVVSFRMAIDWLPHLATWVIRLARDSIG